MRSPGYLPSILGFGPDCPTCGEGMDPSVTYHPDLYESVESWTCPVEDCDQNDLIRDEDAVSA